LPSAIGDRLGFKIGAHFGEIVASRLGESHQHITATGDTVNVASRLLEIAKQHNATTAISDDCLIAAGKPSTCVSFKAHRAAVRGRAKPVVVWSGTWEYTPQQVAKVTRLRRSRLQILASEKNARDYQRLRGLVDGNAYYWSSVNPRRYPDYLGKLREMSAAVHADRGLWIAPAAPGFDARLIGGKSTVARHNGATLRAELAAATASSPDAVGLISWNEFSENSHVEPSRRYGRRALQVLADVRGAKPPAAPEVDSSEPSSTSTGNRNGVPLAGGLAVPCASTRAHDAAIRARTVKGLRNMAYVIPMITFAG